MDLCEDDRAIRANHPSEGGISLTSKNGSKGYATKERLRHKTYALLHVMPMHLPINHNNKEQSTLVAGN